jgi:hypothetical protein
MKRLLEDFDKSMFIENGYEVIMHNGLHSVCGNYSGAMVHIARYTNGEDADALCNMLNDLNEPLHTAAHNTESVTDQYLIAWTTKEQIDLQDDTLTDVDNWHIADGIIEAKAFYNGLVDSDPDLYSASMCAIIESTDYTTHPLLKRL